MKTDTARFHLVLPQWLKYKLKAKADEKGISMAEYIKDLLKEAVKD